MGAAWGRAWRSNIISSTAHGGNSNTGEGGDDGRWLQRTTGATESTTTGTTWTNTSGSTTTGTTWTNTSGSTTTGTTWTNTSGSDPVQEQLSFDFLHRPVVADELRDEERMKRLEDIKALVVRFPSDSSAPERWLSELEVSWVLHLSHGGKSGRGFISGQLLYLARSWILALFEITKATSIYFGAYCSQEDGSPAASEFIRFIEATLSKMLPFVDAIVAVRTCRFDERPWGAVEPADEKLQALILLRDALSAASLQTSSAEPLIAKLDQAIWDTVEETRTSNMSPCWWATTTRRSSDIHPITRCFISYIKVLWANYQSVNRILHDAFLRGEFFMPVNEKSASHLANLTIEMVHSLEGNLTSSWSQSFPDQSLKFLFLINNFQFILQQLHTNCPLGFLMPNLDGKIDDYVSSYIKVSWTPVLTCLRDPTLHCFTRHSALRNFESKFQKTYTAQKLCKVPDPERRKRMREAIVEEVIPAFTEFLNDNTIRNQGITPQEMKRMLQELFEG